MNRENPIGNLTKKWSTDAQRAGQWPALASSKRACLALGELERAASLCLAVLLALDHSRVAREEAAALEDRAQVRLEVGQCLGDAVTHGARLPRQPTAGHRAYNVVLPVAVGSNQR